MLIKSSALGHTGGKDGQQRTNPTILIFASEGTEEQTVY
jgi:hypothetical protein